MVVFSDVLVVEVGDGRRQPRSPTGCNSLSETPTKATHEFSLSLFFHAASSTTRSSLLGYRQDGESICYSKWMKPSAWPYPYPYPRSPVGRDTGLARCFGGSEAQIADSMCRRSPRPSRTAPTSGEFCLSILELEQYLTGPAATKPSTAVVARARPTTMRASV